MASAAVRSKAVVLLLLNHFSFIAHCFVGVLCLVIVLFGGLSVVSSFANILLG